MRAVLPPTPTTPCILWEGKQGDGYGYLYEDGKKVYAHRRACEEANGPIPLKWEVDHLCNVSLCVRGDHLEAVTKTENLRRQGERQTRCKHNHEYTEANTYRDGKGHRRCVTCAREAEAKRVRVRSAA